MGKWKKGWMSLTGVMRKGFSLEVTYELKAQLTSSVKL